MLLLLSMRMETVRSEAVIRVCALVVFGVVSTAAAATFSSVIMEAVARAVAGTVMRDGRPAEAGMAILKILVVVVGLSILCDSGGSGGNLTGGKWSTPPAMDDSMAWFCCLMASC
ncbi:hypothetical protein Vafri_14184, partial [Volvox africanus]